MRRGVVSSPTIGLLPPDVTGMVRMVTGMMPKHGMLLSELILNFLNFLNLMRPFSSVFTLHILHVGNRPPGPRLAKFLEFPPKQSRALISSTSHPAAPTGWVAFVPAQASQRSTLWSQWSRSRPRNDGVWWEAGFVRLSDFLA